MKNSKKTAIALISGVLLILFFNLKSISAQGHKKDQGSFAGDGLVLIEEKIDKIMDMISQKGSLDKANKEVTVKLDKILSNQEKILSELEIVKVRATKR